MNGTRTDARESTRTMALALAAGTALTLASASTALAAPRGERVARGRVEIARDGAVTTIKASNKAIINFESFDIASGETVRFVQPGATARVLNRVTGPGPSQIDGALLANGQVYIVNPAGVIFGANSIVNAAGLVAAGAALSDRDFLDGVDRFTNVAGPVVAEGLITAEAVRLVGTRVENAGTIVAEHGLASMMVGSDVLVRERGGTIAVRLEGGTVENSGTISAPGGLVSLGAGDAASLAVRNTGAVRAPGGAVTVGAAQVTNAGEISADALGAGAGAVRVVSSQRTVLESGSRVSAAGGAGTGAGGEVLVHSIGGDTAMAPGAVVDVSGGALGGDGGFAEVSATGRLDVRGTLRGETAPGFTPATLLLDPFNIVIQTPGAQDAELGDGRVLADQGAPSDTWRVSPASIEGFSGDVRLEATNDIFVTESINKANGGLTLLAGRDIVFGDEFGGFVLDVQVSAHTLDFSARRDIVDRALLTTTLSATVGDLRLRAEAGAAAHGLLSVPSGRTVFITQADSLFVGAGPFGFVANPEQTNLSINVTQGFLILGGDFGGVSGNQAIQNIEATAQEFLEIQDDLAIGNSASFMSFGDVRVDGDVLAQGAVEFHGGLDGTGGVSFLTPGLEVQGLAIMVAAGNGAGGPTGATADAVTNAPFFNGPGGPGTAPAAFTLMQDGAITDAHLPSLAQFGGSVDGVSYLIQSSDGGVVLSPEKVADSALTISSMRGTTIDRALRARSLVVRGPLEIGADITTTSLQRYEGPVTLLSDVTLTGTEMAFLSTLDGPGGLRDVGATVFGGPVGAGVALRFLTLDGPAALTGGSVRTVGGQAYNGPVTLGAHSVLESIGDGVLAFNAALDGPFDLRLTTTEGGLIRFAAPVGGATALRSLFLSTGGADGVREVPSAATVVGVGDQSFRVLDFTMSQHEKLTVLGSLDLGASRSATLGDVVAAGDMLINAPSVTLLRRQPGTLDGPDGASFDDRGLDFVAGGSITFTGDVVLGGDAGAPAPTFGTGEDSITGIDRAEFEVSVSPAEDTALGSLVEGSRVFDQRTRADAQPPQPPMPPGPSDPGDTANDVAAASRPVSPEFADTVTPEAYAVNLLQRIALLGRGVTDAEAADAMIGRAIFNDLPGSPSVTDAALLTVATRLHRPAVEAAVARFDAVFGPEGEDRSPQVRALVERTAGRYLSLAEGGATSPQAFSEWLGSEAGEPGAGATLAGLTELLGRLRSIGLTNAEYRAARDRILGAVAPEGVSVEALAGLIEGAPLAREARAGASAG